jgi:hypothetical protein
MWKESYGHQTQLQGLLCVLKKFSQNGIFGTIYQNFNSVLTLKARFH